MAVTAKRDLVSIEDLSTAEILELFRHADTFRDDLRAWSHICRGTIMATLFFEPSTRTRLSFESAMHRLGGGVITAADEKNTSRSKGESLADTSAAATPTSSSSVTRKMALRASRRGTRACPS
jgi:aspartate carbamoyltransferase catalytic subunit